ncbi:MAG: beta-ketoacyl-ACP synthase III [Muribaculaceae bacterium]
MIMLNAKISGIASFVPDDRLTNEELSRLVETNDEWITTRVGIKERRILKEPCAGSSELGYKAINNLLKSTKVNPDEIELVICATSNPDFRFPSTASIISHKCGLKNAYAFDIQAACAGFLVALQAGASYIKSGIYKKVIVVAAEKMSSMTDYTDRSTCPLFGDAAGCVLLEPTEENLGIIDSVFHINGEGLPHLIMKGGGATYPATHESIDAHEHYLHQDGRVVYRHAVTNMLGSTLEVIARNNLSTDSVDWFIPHQANLRIIEAVGSRVGIDPKKVLVNIEHYGNTSAASIPLCIDEYKDKLKKGDKLVLTAFGAGFTWGAMYIVWGC